MQQGIEQVRHTFKPVRGVKCIDLVSAWDKKTAESECVVLHKMNF